MHNNMNVNVSGPVQASAMQSYQTIVLKYNIVDGHNLLTQEMMSQENTIYVIKWDFELAENITIPANCVLEFDGGSISAGSGENKDTITGNNTGIEAGLVKIFSTDVTLAGTWNVAEAYPEWFGAKGDDYTDDTQPIEKTINSFSTTSLTNTYLITDTLNIEESGKTIYSNSEGCIHQTANECVINIGKEGIELDNFKILCTNTYYNTYALKIHRISPITNTKKNIISRLSIQKTFSTTEYSSIGVLFEDTAQIGLYNIIVKDCIIRNFSRGCLFYAISGYINSNLIQGVYFAGCKTAIKMVSNTVSDSMIFDNRIINCSFQNNPSSEYSSQQNAIDCFGANIYDNIIDIYLWDMDPIPNTIGSCFGNIGKNQYITKHSYCYKGNFDYLFLGAVPIGSTLFGSTPFGVKTLCPECSFEILVEVTKDSTFNIKKCQFTPAPNLIGTFFEPILYYKIINSVVYFYLYTGTGNNFYLELTNATNAIISNVAVPAARGEELTELYRLARTIGTSNTRINPAKYTLEGFVFYDRSLRKPLYRDSGAADGVAKWYDATGATV